MALSLDPEIAPAPAPTTGAAADTAPPAVGSITARRALWDARWGPRSSGVCRVLLPRRERRAPAFLLDEEPVGEVADGSVPAGQYEEFE